MGTRGNESVFDSGGGGGGDDSDRGSSDRKNGGIWGGFIFEGDGLVVRLIYGVVVHIF